MCEKFVLAKPSPCLARCYYSAAIMRLSMAHVPREMRQLIAEGRNKIKKKSGILEKVSGLKQLLLQIQR